MKCSTEWAIERSHFWWKLLWWGHAYGTPMELALIKPPRVEFSSRMTSTAGFASSSLHRIKLSLYFMEHEEPEDFDETIAHEICHVFTDRFFGKRCIHGPLWREMMRSIGGRESRCHQYLTAAQRAPKVEAYCDCGLPHLITQRTANKMRRGQVRICLGCRGKLRLS